MNEPFSKFCKDILLIGKLTPDPCHDVEALYQSPGCFYAYFTGSGLRPITDVLYTKLSQYLKPN